MIKITKVKTKKKDRALAVESPYSPEFPPRARQLGGTWDRSHGAWIFDARDEDLVRELCRDVYGTDGADEGRLVTLRARCRGSGTFSSWSAGGTSFFLGPVQVARVFDRDGGARLEDGVIVLNGRLYSGGSRRYPEVCAKADTVVELRDLPEGVAKKVIDADTRGWEISKAAEDIDHAALIEERGRLLARIEEIDAILSWQSAAEA